MQCFHHAAVAAVAICTRCDHPLCPECQQERNGRTFCVACAQFLDRRNVERTTGSIPVMGGPPSAPPSQAPVAARAVAPPPSVPAPPSANPAPSAAPAGAHASSSRPLQAAPVAAAPMPPAPPAPPSAVVPAAPAAAAEPATTPVANTAGASPAAAASQEPYLGTPVSEISGGDAPPLWFGDDDIIPIKPAAEPPPAPPPPAPPQGQTAFASSLSQAEGVADSAEPAADVYQGDVYGGEGDGSPGDVYQGDVYQGDVYQGESTSEDEPTFGGAEVKGVPLRGLIVGIFAGTLGAIIWYSLTVATHWQFSLVSWLIGVGVAVAAVAGTGRGGTDVAVIAASITALAIFLGEFQIAKYFETQENAIYEQAEAIERDGDYTDEEVAMLSGLSFDDFSGLSKSEKELLRMLAQVGDEDYEGYDDGDSGVEDDWQNSTLTMGFFLGHIKYYMGWKGILFWLIGIGAAFRIPLGSSD